VASVPDRPGPGAAFTPTDWLVFASIAGIWGGSFLFIKVGLESMEPGVVTLARVGLGAVTLNLLPGARVRFEGSDGRRMVGLSMLWVGLPFSLFPIAEQHLNSAVTGLLNGATPMFTALFGWLLFRRRAEGPQLLGVGVGFVGIVLISLPSIDEGPSAAWGVALILVATSCYGLAVHIAAPLQARYGSLAVMGRMLALATIWTAPFGLWGLRDSHVELRPILAVSVLGVVGTGLAFLLMGSLMGRVGSVRSSFITYLIPVVSLFLGVAFQDDHVELLALLGVVLVVAGAVLASRQEAPARPFSRSSRPSAAGGGATPPPRGPVP
jgi:drug/metabolite transporter (DMT)-like permease